jgi:hypothetical protein
MKILSDQKSLFEEAKQADNLNNAELSQVKFTP